MGTRTHAVEQQGINVAEEPVASAEDPVVNVAAATTQGTGYWLGRKEFISWRVGFPNDPKQSNAKP